MFGHQDDKPSDQEHDDAAGTTEIAEVAQDLGQETEQTTEQPAEPTDSPAEEAAAPEAITPVASSDEESWQHPGTPVEEDRDERIRNAVSPAGGFPKHPSSQYPGTGSPLSGGDAADPADKELLEVRQKALSDLAPLIDKLDLPPEEKFRTIMMIIQTSDDQKLVNAAYEAAHSIEDEKTRGQALLDVINEINYFTHPDGQES